MDYSLKSLREAFEDAEYKQSRVGYDIYILLLATSLDQSFVLEYLSLYHELDALTGERVLVIGPHLGHFEGASHAKPNLIHSSELFRVRQVISHEESDTSSASSGSLTVAEQFLAFMQEQTRESYALSRFLGISISSMPLLVFFDNLDKPSKRVEWPLEGKSGREFVRDLRSILEVVSEKCGWNLLQQQEQLEHKLESLCRNYHRSWDVPYELRAEWEAYKNANEELSPAIELAEYYERLAALRLAFDRAQAAEVRVPFENVGITISQLESGRIYRDAFSHLDRHYQRWKSRMPADYKEALRKMHYLNYTVYVRSGFLTLTRDEAQLEALRLGQKTNELKNTYDEKKRKLCTKVESSLAKVKDLSHQKQPALSVIERVLGRASETVINEHSLRAQFGDFIRERHDRIPTVFVSYSNDSKSHAARVLELAQRLRADGIDCWIDQFEHGPAEGFPRWMVQQINRADIVLIVCTQSYRRRFDGLEEHGKGLGASFEGYLILQELYDLSMRQRKFIPILLPQSSREDIPRVLRGTEYFDIPGSYRRLVDRILGFGGVAPHQLGEPMEPRWSF